MLFSTSVSSKAARRDERCQGGENVEHIPDNEARKIMTCAMWGQSAVGNPEKKSTAPSSKNWTHGAKEQGWDEG